MRPSIHDVSLRTHATLEKVLKTIDATGLGVVFIVDDDGSLRGVMTDGDIRRAMLSGAERQDVCTPYMNRRFTAGNIGAEKNENLRLMSEKILYLPLLDRHGHLVDYISWRDMWQLPLVSPALSGNELKYVTECITTGWISSRGPFVGNFEEAVKGFVGTKFALSSANGTLALQLAMRALDLGPGDEVIVPDFTFGASANAVVQCGATPVFADIDPDTWTLDPAATEAMVTPRTKAIMPVHIYGHPCDMDPLMEIADRYGLKVIEDCAEAIGAEYKGRAIGSIGDIGCFSFFANKIVTTGEGGMMTTSDPALFDRLKLLRDHGMHPERRYWHVEAGTNGRMTNLQAAVGLAQMERITAFIQGRDRIAAAYEGVLANTPGVQPHVAAPWARKVCWLFTVRIDASMFGMDRDAMIAKLHAMNMETRPVFLPLHSQPAYFGSRHGPVHQSERLSGHGLSLPTSNEMPIIETLRVGQAIHGLSRAAA